MGKSEEPITFYDSVSGKPLYIAPQGRTWDQFIKESEKHGWPSFRDDEVSCMLCRMVMPLAEVALSMLAIVGGVGECEVSCQW